MTQTDTNLEGRHRMLPSERATEVVKQRGTQYGHPAPIYRIVAGMWEEILSTTNNKVVISEQQVALCMIALKLAREAIRHNADNLTDICGYANVYEMMGDDCDTTVSG